MTKRNTIYRFGHVSRMDSLQASILGFKLKNLNSVILQRRKNYEIYRNNLNRKHIFFPEEKKYQYNTYHTFVIQVKNRNKLKKFLEAKKLKHQYITQSQYTCNQLQNF